MERLKSYFYKAEDLWEKQNFREKLFDYIYLILFSLYLLQSSFWNTMIVIPWPSEFHNYLHMTLGFFIFFKFANSKNINLKHTIFMLVLLIGFVTAWKNTGYDALFDLVLLIMGAYGINYRKILKIYLSINIPVTICTVIASQLGLITNLIYTQDGRIRESFGFVFPTDFAARIFFIIAVWVILRQARCSLIELGVMITLVIFLYLKSDTRCSEISILLIVAGIIYLKIRNFIAKKQGNQYHPSKYTKVMCFLSPFIFAPIMILLSRFYNPDYKVMVYLNQILSQRLKLGKRTFDDYDVKLFGQYIEMKGNGGSTEKNYDYTFIDCSYTNILMRFGLVVFIIVLLIIEVVMLKNIKNIYIIGLIVLVCMHSVIEHHLFEYYYNIFILLPFASFQKEKNTNTLSKIKDFISKFILRKEIR